MIIAKGLMKIIKENKSSKVHLKLTVIGYFPRNFRKAFNGLNKFHKLIISKTNHKHLKKMD